MYNLRFVPFWHFRTPGIRTKLSSYACRLIFNFVLDHPNTRYSLNEGIDFTMQIETIILERDPFLNEGGNGFLPDDDLSVKGYLINISSENEEFLEQLEHEICRYLQNLPDKWGEYRKYVYCDWLMHAICETSHSYGINHYSFIPYSREVL